MYKIKINSYEDRKNVAKALIENGYTIREEKKEERFGRDFDYFIVIVEEPKLPEYR